tara:strand:- start:3463 stop:3609 length:147 start_codon:yes stop_codon:yes gene_type:complete
MGVVYGLLKYLAFPASGASMVAFNNPADKNATPIQNVKTPKPIKYSVV